jgi:hypothetical protein
LEPVINTNYYGKESISIQNRFDFPSYEID